VFTPSRTSQGRLRISSYPLRRKPITGQRPPFFLIQPSNSETLLMTTINTAAIKSNITDARARLEASNKAPVALPVNVATVTDYNTRAEYALVDADAYIGHADEVAARIALVEVGEPSAADIAVFNDLSKHAQYELDRANEALAEAAIFAASKATP
jgi:hypothetical protein